MLADAEKSQVAKSNAPPRITFPANGQGPPTAGLGPEGDTPPAGEVGDQAGSGRRGRDGRGRSGGPNREELMKLFDKNGDGELDEGERAAMRESFGAGRTNRADRPRGGGESSRRATPDDRPARSGDQNGESGRAP